MMATTTGTVVLMVMAVAFPATLARLGIALPFAWPRESNW